MDESQKGCDRIGGMSGRQRFLHPVAWPAAKV